MYSWRGRVDTSTLLLLLLLLLFVDASWRMSCWVMVISGWVVGVRLRSRRRTSLVVVVVVRSWCLTKRSSGSLLSQVPSSRIVAIL